MEVISGSVKNKPVNDGPEGVEYALAVAGEELENILYPYTDRKVTIYITEKGSESEVLSEFSVDELFFAIYKDIIKRQSSNLTPQQINDIAELVTTKLESLEDDLIKQTVEITEAYVEENDFFVWEFSDLNNCKGYLFGDKETVRYQLEKLVEKFPEAGYNNLIRIRKFNGCLRDLSGI